MIATDDTENIIDQTLVSDIKVIEEEVVTSISYHDWITGVVFDDFHFLLASYLLPLDLQQLVRVNHYWHDKIRYDAQRFFIADEIYTWAKSFKDLSNLAQEVLEDTPSLYLLFAQGIHTESDDDNELDEMEGESEEMEEEEESSLVDFPTEEIQQMTLADPEHQVNDLTGEENPDSNPYDEFLHDLDYIQGSSRRNICFDDYFFDLEHESYRVQFCQLLSNPARQLCFYLQNTTITDFARLGVRPWKVVYLMTYLNRIDAIKLPYFNHIDTVEIHGDLSLTIQSLDGLSGIRVLRISRFNALRRIGGQLSSLEEVRIAHCHGLESICGLESVKRARFEDLSGLIDISPIQNCEELYLSQSVVRSVKGFNQLRSLTVLGCSSFAFETDLGRMPKLQSLEVEISPFRIPFSQFPSLQHIHLVFNLSDGAFQDLALPLSLRTISINFRRVFSNQEFYDLSRFHHLQEFTLKSSSSIYFHTPSSNLIDLNTLSQSLRRVKIIDCRGIHNLEGLSRVQSIELVRLEGLTQLQGINPHLQSLHIQQCKKIENWNGLLSVQELIIDYAEIGYDKASEIIRFGEIVKKKLILRRSRMIDVLVGIENIPILELDRCTGLQYFSNFRNQKIVVDKTTSVLYGSKFNALSAKQGLYLREDYGDKIVLIRK